ncbi:Copper chaperone CopZ [Desulfatibacillum alkenivorans DSM 16219]|jgi:copper chaperone CopZ|uniref:Copper chaperone CopZ n=1 Tax=Desulfatibacillum alkenivorans DSM 16219 TaxID=1121393 RepID=A0A1M6RA37_9BACT|nr:heavy-metal-associated domain-containing protein [Desulfatibacillum alkenivorans]SHK29343.1 Copper chaperone CopZ [Desulfatibacillum alkenivorans DSM 16219]
MEEKTFTVPNISCGHCVNAIKEELNEADGVAGVEGDPGSKTIKVKWDSPATEDSIRAILKEINYPAE